MTRARRGGRGGFTLLEVVIVAAILGVIVTLALPNLLEARRAGELAQLRQDVEVIRKAWATCVGSGRPLTDPELRSGGSTGLRSQTGEALKLPAPAPLMPLLETMPRGTLTRTVLSLDPGGQPVVVPEANGVPAHLLTETAEVPRFVGPRGIEFQTFVFRAGGVGGVATRSLQSRLSLPEYSVALALHGRGPAVDLLRSLRTALAADGTYKVHYEEAGDLSHALAVSGTRASGGASAHLTLYFVP